MGFKRTPEILNYETLSYGLNNSTSFKDFCLIRWFVFRKREKMMRGREINHHQRKYKNQIFYLVDFSIPNYKHQDPTL